MSMMFFEIPRSRYTLWILSNTYHIEMLLELISVLVAPRGLRIQEHDMTKNSFIKGRRGSLWGNGNAQQLLYARSHVSVYRLSLRWDRSGLEYLGSSPTMNILHNNIGDIAGLKGAVNRWNRNRRP